MPKAYAFDTGFVAYARGWDPLRPEDYGLLWEHIVLERLQAGLPDQRIQYWRDKKGREVDFVLPGAHGAVDVIECKWNADSFDPQALRAFRARYPDGRNWLFTPSDESGYEREMGGLRVHVGTPSGATAQGALWK